MNAKETPSGPPLTADDLPPQIRGRLQQIQDALNAALADDDLGLSGMSPVHKLQGTDLTYLAGLLSGRLDLGLTPDAVSPMHMLGVPAARDWLKPRHRPALNAVLAMWRARYRWALPSFQAHFTMPQGWRLSVVYGVVPSWHDRPNHLWEVMFTRHGQMQDFNVNGVHYSEITRGQEQDMRALVLQVAQALGRPVNLRMVAAQGLARRLRPYRTPQLAVPVSALRPAGAA